MKISSNPSRLETAHIPLNLTRDEIVQKYRRHVSTGLATIAEYMKTPLEFSSAGSLVFDENGEAYLDCGGYGVFIVGHCHPTVVAAVSEQLHRHPLSTHFLLNPELAKAAENLAAVTPQGLNYVHFTNSGTESTETGIKIARLNGKSKLIAMHSGFHGKTMGALSIAGRAKYKNPFYPLLPDVQLVRFGDIDDLHEVLKHEGEHCCVILEPVQGEGGVIIPPEGYLRAVKQLCTQTGAFLIVDEIQSGMGRLGSWWGIDQEGIIPDVLLVGKGLSGGTVPVSAAVVTDAAYKPLNNDPTLHTSTFAGNPLAMVAAQSAIQVIKDENLVSRSRTLGEKLLQILREVLLESCPHLIVDVRGRGLLIGIEFKAHYIAGDFISKLLQKKVLVTATLNAQNVVRLTPSALLTEEQYDWLVKAVQEVAYKIR